MKRVIATARVQIMISIPVPDQWGEDCAFSQVKKQAVDSAVGMIAKGGMRQGTHYTVIGEPIVKAILVEDV
jgi:hypothetical protein